ncbi:MAG: TIR domain-containing protein [Caulobacteraceae bacterium]|nr:TIR domain-containing protein [Caulobacteraceae bacterium]
MPDIFLSYSREDQATARRFAEAFAAEGLDVWWDVTLRSGEAYDEVTEAALKSAKAVVVLWSGVSTTSRWVRSEATLADRRGVLAPAMIEACERPIMFELTQTADLAHWQGEPDDPAWRGFVADVRRFIDQQEGVAPVALAPVAAPAPPKRGKRGGAPSLAVLPFTNRSGLTEDEAFASGMVEDIVEALSRGVEVRVIASSAIARFRSGGVVDLEGLGRQLGVRYALEGNVRRSGQTLRVTTQLVEVAEGAVIWSERFDRPLDQLFDLQEALVLEVAGRLRAQTHRAEIERALRKPGDLTAWEAVHRAVAAYRKMTPEALMLGLQEARRALEIAPDYAVAMALVAQAEGMIYNQLVPDNPAEVERIHGLAERAIALDPDNTVVLSTAAGALHNIGFPEESLAAAQRAVKLNPENEFGHQQCGISLTLLGRHDEALAAFAREVEAAPGHPAISHSWLWNAFCHVRADRWEEAVVVYDRLLDLTPNNAAPNIGKAVCCQHLGRLEEASTSMQRARRAEPITPLVTWRMRWGRALRESPLREEFLACLDAAWASAEAQAA